MNTNQSRLPRAASNPAMRQPTVPLVTSRLPAPVRPSRQNTVSRKPSIPLRSNRQINRNECEKPSIHPVKSISAIAVTSPAKRLLPSRSTLSLTKKLPSTIQSSNTLQPKRTISSTASSRSTSATSTAKGYSLAVNDIQRNASTHSRGIDQSQIHNENGQENVFQVEGQKDKSTLVPISNIRKKEPVTKRGVHGLGTPSRPSRIPVTPSSQAPSQLSRRSPAGPAPARTPALPRLASMPWTPSADEQLKDLELSFSAEDDTQDASSMDPLDFGFATSRFALRPTAGKGFRYAAHVGPRASDTSTPENVQNKLMERKQQSEEVREAWNGVKRAGEGDLEAVRLMMELIETLTADLEQSQQEDA
ncbi:uncharacterized protein I303_107889 [Kwoniella dejecticola CBS 10117]|uniref:Uncharacterized protein n=1 Tax=Kwoniella dejecticola CBS 10117 TaxID=1296121 RepID=A0A1A5ZVZ4_9TREE|nr:uncharacterized protein I303_07891 [Kwoniella dejecticola CBS 10117]OBR81978.1 hypothetical protein I303_07891 [Kwoniella dejecticola CBS 10117]